MPSLPTLHEAVWEPPVRVIEVPLRDMAAFFAIALLVTAFVGGVMAWGAGQ